MTSGTTDGWLPWGWGLFAGMTVVDVVTLGVLCFTAVKVARGRPRTLLLRARRRALGGLGVSRGAMRDRVNALMQGEAPTAAQELAWLAGATDLGRDESVTFGDRERAGRVADAYAAYTATLDASALLGANHAPVVRAEAARGAAVAGLAARYAALRATGRQSVAIAIPHRAMVLQVLGSTSGEASPMGPTDLHVSYRDSRLDLDDLGVDPARRVAIEAYLDRPNFFDGVLPRVVAWQSERDLRSGRRGLHLSLAEARYSAVVADHYPLVSMEESGTPAPVSGSTVGLLTLSLVVVTSCSHILFTRRSKKSGSHPGRLGPAVNGNLEFEPRHGIAVDLDAFGMPDLTRALAREAREELGLQVDAKEIVVTGLGRFDAPSEVGTYVLLCYVTVDQTRDDVFRGMRHADPLEGAWEVEQELVSLRVPSDLAGRAAAIDWLLGSADLTPHATLAGLAALAVCLRDDRLLEHALESPGLTSEVAAPPSLVQRCDSVGVWS